LLHDGSGVGDIKQTFVPYKIILHASALLQIVVHFCPTYGSVRPEIRGKHVVNGVFLLNFSGKDEEKYRKGILH